MAQHLIIYENGKKTESGARLCEDFSSLESMLDESIVILDDSDFLFMLKEQFDMGFKVGYGAMKINHLGSNRYGLERKDSPNEFILEGVLEGDSKKIFFVM